MENKSNLDRFDIELSIAGKQRKSRKEGKLCALAQNLERRMYPSQISCFKNHGMVAA